MPQDTWSGTAITPAGRLSASCWRLVGVLGAARPKGLGALLPNIQRLDKVRHAQFRAPFQEALALARFVFDVPRDLILLCVQGLALSLQRGDFGLPCV